LLGQIVTLLLPSILGAAEVGNLSVGGIVSPATAAGAGCHTHGIISAIENKATA
jgi:hypothetical protein